MCNWSVGSRCNRTICSRAEIFVSNQILYQIINFGFFEILSWFLQLETLWEVGKLRFPSRKSAINKQYLGEKSRLRRADSIYRSFPISSDVVETICKLGSNSIGEKLRVLTIIPENHWVGILYDPEHQKYVIKMIELLSVIIIKFVAISCRIRFLILSYVLWAIPSIPEIHMRRTDRKDILHWPTEEH